jgi:carbamoyltransferase
LGVLARPQEILASSHPGNDGSAGWVDRPQSNERRSAVHLRIVLVEFRMRILGISAYYHDSAAAVIVDGRIVAAVQEERFTRRKHDASFPRNALAYCLKRAGCSLGELDAIAFYDKPFLKFERLLETYLSFAPVGFSSFRKAMPLWLREKLFQKDLLLRELQKINGDSIDSKKILFSEHHFAHAASAYFPSPFDNAAVLTMDGVGEWTTSSLAIGSGKDLAIQKELYFPHSLGLLYSAFTYYTGFKVNSGEYKVMGLAPYGEPKYAQRILDHVVDVKKDGTFWLNQAYFDYCTGLTMTNRRFSDLFGHPARKPDELLTQFHMDMAASVQFVTEEIVLRLARSIRQETGLRNLCLAGGVALNCVANGKLMKEGIFDDIWIQPAAGDAGGSVGAALAAYHVNMGQPRQTRPNGSSDGMSGAYLGPEFAQDEIERELAAAQAQFVTLSDD